MRLIDADKIEPHEQLESLGNGQYEYVHVAYMDDIDALPTVDAVPVVHGEWILHHDVFGEPVAECSRCKVQGIILGNFCPNCGADMRKDGEQHDTK